MLVCETGVRTAIHFATFSQGGESVDNLGKYIHHNGAVILNITEATQAAGVRNTAAVYSIPERCPITEDMPTAESKSYGETKLFMEWMLMDFARACGLSWTSLRYFNAV